MKPTPEQIQAEVSRLRARLLAEPSNIEAEAMIDALTGEIDPTAPEFDELEPVARDAAREALEWRDGLSRVLPSLRL